MTSQKTFPHFEALSEGIRHDIWERAAWDIFTTPSVRFVTISRREPDEATDNRISEETWATAAIMAQAEADPNWTPLTHHFHVQVTSIKAVDRALLRYHTSLISIAPGKGDWPFASLAAVCFDAHKLVGRLLRMAGKRRGNNVSSIFGPAEHSIICLERPEANSANSIDDFPLFTSFMNTPRAILVGNQQPQYTEKQIVVVGSRSTPDSETLDPDYGTFDPYSCPTFPELYPPTAAVKRVGFVYEEQGVSGPNKPFHLRLGLDALWPLNLPNLKEIYLIDKSIRLRVTPTGNRQQDPGVVSPSFAGCQGTFHEVSPAAVEVWDIQTSNNDLLSVFTCAASLEACYHMGDTSVPQVLVKVLAFIPHTRSV